MPRIDSPSVEPAKNGQLGSTSHGIAVLTAESRSFVRTPSVHQSDCLQSTDSVRSSSLRRRIKSSRSHHEQKLNAIVPAWSSARSAEDTRNRFTEEKIERTIPYIGTQYLFENRLSSRVIAHLALAFFRRRQ